MPEAKSNEPQTSASLSRELWKWTRTFVARCLLWCSSGSQGLALKIAPWLKETTGEQP